MTELEILAERIAGETQAFNGDKALAVAVAEIIYNSSDIIETGTWDGATTRWFRQMYPTIKYRGVELDFDKWQRTVENVPGVDVALSDSATWLSRNLPRFGAHPFFFLDAHGYNDVPDRWVLEDELSILANIPDPIILIHDFDDGSGLNFVPGLALSNDVVARLIRPDLVVHRSKVKLSVVGAVLLSKPLESEHWEAYRP